MKSTCWTMILGAADGVPEELDEFVGRYGPIVRAYLSARWRTEARRAWVDDASQEVFVECFKEGGVLVRAVAKRASNDLPSFRNFLNGVLRNVVLRFEHQRAPACHLDSALDDQLPSDVETPDAAFDRAWAEAILHEAGERQAARAQIMGGEALKRLELLERHFVQHESIADIARPWGFDSRAAHRLYTRAQRDFREALDEVLRFHYPGDHPATQAEGCKLLNALTKQSA